ncbi:MAG: MerR family transcriptional regulator [Nitrospirae bacterium]|nr:MerR family transcriptional regulator [Nitrospirota bacterium]MBI3351451.1 MerR family transcriptional regulator [Nitrospirota bacterium]
MKNSKSRKKQRNNTTGKSEKMFYKIGEVSQITGLESYVLRFWENQFPVLHPKKNNGGQRVYLSKDIQLILKIKKMLYEEGYTIIGAKKALRQHSGGPAPASDLFQIQKELKGILDLLH